MKHALLAALLLGATALPALTAPIADPTTIQGGDFKVDPDHTQVLFGVDHFGFSFYYGRFSQPSGSLTLSPKSLGASAFDISIPTASVNTSSEKLNGELKSPEWLDAEKYPTMTFHSVSVTQTGAETADVVGNLTLHGVTKPVTLHVTLHGAGPNPFFKTYTVGFEATGELKRSDFGVTKYLPAIGDEVRLTLAAAFVKA